MVLGYFKRRSQQLTSISTCAVSEPRLLELSRGLKPYLHTIVGGREPVNFFFQCIGSTAELVVTGPVGRGRPDNRVREALAQFAGELHVARVAWSPDTDSRPQVLLQSAPLTASFGSLRVELPAAAFVQATAPGETALVEIVKKHLPREGRLADLFSGSGTFSGPMLEAGAVDAFESDGLAVAALSNASKGSTLRAFKRDLFLNPLGVAELGRYAAVVFDPPRTGCREQAEKMAKSIVPTLISVSCNPATFARDAHILCNGGYRLEKVQVVDQFHWSHHVELVGIFRKGRGLFQRQPKEQVRAVGKKDEVNRKFSKFTKGIVDRSRVRRHSEQ